MMFGVPLMKRNGVACQADNGSEFKGLVAKIMKEKEVVCFLAAIQTTIPKGVIETFNQTIQKKLHSIIAQTGEQDWLKILDQDII